MKSLILMQINTDAQHGMQKVVTCYKNKLLFK